MSKKSVSGVVIPDDLVTVGYVSGAYGLNGWVRVKPHSPDADALLNATSWWIDKPEQREVGMAQAKTHSGDVVASLVGVVGREGAEALKGATVQIPRSHFPVLANDEYYWVDLIGLQVENQQGLVVGLVADMMDNGAHPILRVTPAATSDDEKVQEILIPFVDHFVKTVDLKAKIIVVDWALDY